MQSFEYARDGRYRRWLWTVTHHAWHDPVTTRAWSDRAHGDNAVEVGIESPEACEDLLAMLDSRHERELYEEAGRQVRANLRSDKTWEAFRLLSVEGKSGAEAVAALGLSVDACYEARRRVTALLRAKVRELGETTND